MNTLALSLATRTGTLPSGTAAGKFRFVVTGASGAKVTQDEVGTSSTFTSIADDNGTATCQRLDTDGNPFGNIATASWGLSIPPPSTFDEPATLTVTVTPQ